MDAFVDDQGSVHEASINCAAALGLVSGRTPSTFEERGRLTRGQAATLLVNYVERSTGAPLGIGSTPDFSDSGGVHSANIEKAADNGIVRGFSDDTFRPDQLVTRAQFASIAVQATERVLGLRLGVDGADAFDDDDGSVHEGNIEKAVDHGILQGTGPRSFLPATTITRGQAATIIVRAVTSVLAPAGRFAA